MNKFIDLHCHLDGAITLPIAKELARIQNIETPDDKTLEKLLTVPESCTSLDDMLKCFAFPLTLLQTHEGIKNAVRLVLEDFKANGVVYAELRFCPSLHANKGLTPEDAVVAAIDGIKESPIKANLILCAMRGLSDSDNELTLKLVSRYLVPDGGVVAFDIAGAEKQYPFETYCWILKKAEEKGVPFTVHAGEAAGSKNVKLAIEAGAKRIGHGVRAVEDPAVVELLIKSKTPLEMCPTSNRMTRAIKDMSKYPLKSFLNNGIKVTVNTDDPAIEGTTISQEFAYTKALCGITEEDEKQILKNSVEAAFTTEEVKSELLKEIFD